MRDCAAWHYDLDAPVDLVPTGRRPDGPPPPTREEWNRARRQRAVEELAQRAPTCRRWRHAVAVLYVTAWCVVVFGALAPGLFGDIVLVTGVALSVVAAVMQIFRPQEWLP